MPITRDTLRLIADLRIRIDGDVDQVTGDLVRSWARLWNELARDWRLATEDLVDEAGAGWPSRNQVLRIRRVRRALDATRAALEDLANRAGATITLPLSDMVTDTMGWESQILASQYPPFARTVSLAATFDRVDPAALAAIVARATEQITSLTRPLAPDSYAAVLSELVRGVALGTNPRNAARQMLRRTEQAFNGGLTRAMRIARTEILDAHRAAAAEHHAANADVIAGWRWTAALSPRTCPGCLALHGTVHKVTEPGPQGHVNCRCARSPVTKTWRQLGFAVDEPEDVFPDARDWFDGLSRADQARIMGPARLALLESGAVAWDDLAVQIANPRWRPSYQARPLRDLRGHARQSA